MSSHTYSVLRGFHALCCRTIKRGWSFGGRGKYRFYSNDHGASGRPEAGNRGMNVFDRKAKRWHKNRAAMAPNADTFDYLRDEVREKKERKERIVTIWWLTTFTKSSTSAWDDPCTGIC